MQNKLCLIHSFYLRATYTSSMNIKASENQIRPPSRIEREKLFLSRVEKKIFAHKRKKSDNESEKKSHKYFGSETYVCNFISARSISGELLSFPYISLWTCTSAFVLLFSLLHVWLLPPSLSLFYPTHSSLYLLNGWQCVHKSCRKHAQEEILIGLGHLI